MLVAEMADRSRSRYTRRDFVAIIGANPASAWGAAHVDEVRSRREGSMRTRLLCAVIGLGLLATVSAQAHHAFGAEFDASKPVTLRGVITKVDWINPHAWLHLDVK